MTALIIDLDSKIPNLALKKIEKYHLDRGDEVIWNLPMVRHNVDKIYVSCIFTKNKEQADEWAEYGAEVGGSGYDLHKNLPPEIENTACRINWGFTTRGCIRHCLFCIVPDKEGMIHAVGDVYDIWDGKADKIMLLDNNILALPDHFKLICGQLIKEKLKVDFNQGLDHRLLDDESCRLLKKIRHKDYRFAYDHPSYLPTVSKAIDLLDKHKLHWNMWYVLVGYDTTFEEDMERLEYLKSRRQRPYVMRHESSHFDRKYILLAQWVNQLHVFQGMTFPQLCKIKGYDAQTFEKVP